MYDWSGVDSIAKLVVFQSDNVAIYGNRSLNYNIDESIPNLFIFCFLTMPLIVYISTEWEKDDWGDHYLIEIFGPLICLSLAVSELPLQFMHIIIQKTIMSMIRTIMKQHSIRQVHTWLTSTLSYKYPVFIAILPPPFEGPLNGPPWQSSLSEAHRSFPIVAWALRWGSFLPVSFFGPIHGSHRCGSPARPRHASILAAFEIDYNICFIKLSTFNHPEWTLKMNLEGLGIW